MPLPGMVHLHCKQRFATGKIVEPTGQLAGTRAPPRSLHVCGVAYRHLGERRPGRYLATMDSLLRAIMLWYDMYILLALLAPPPLLHLPPIPTSLH